MTSRSISSRYAFRPHPLSSCPEDQISTARVSAKDTRNPLLHDIVLCRILSRSCLFALLNRRQSHFQISFVPFRQGHTSRCSQLINSLRHVSYVRLLRRGAVVSSFRSVPSEQSALSNVRLKEKAVREVEFRKQFPSYQAAATCHSHLQISRIGSIERFLACLQQCFAFFFGLGMRGQFGSARLVWPRLRNTEHLFLFYLFYLFFSLFALSCSKSL
jgi:hypothetical protein